MGERLLTNAAGTVCLERTDEPQNLVIRDARSEDPDDWLALIHVTGEDLAQVAMSIWDTNVTSSAAAQLQRAIADKDWAAVQLVAEALAKCPATQEAAEACLLVPPPAPPRDGRIEAGRRRRKDATST